MQNEAYHKPGPGNDRDRSGNVRALFRSRLQDHLRAHMVDAVGSVRWREVMMAAVHDGGNDEGEGALMPFHRLFEESLFAHGGGRVEFLKCLGRTMAQELMRGIDPMVRENLIHKKDGSLRIDRSMFEELGVLSMTCVPNDQVQEKGRLHVEAIRLFSSSSCIQITAFKLFWKEVYGKDLRVDLLSAGEMEGSDYVYGLNW